MRSRAPTSRGWIGLEEDSGESNPLRRNSAEYSPISSACICWPHLHHHCHPRRASLTNRLTLVCRGLRTSPYLKDSTGAMNECKERMAKGGDDVVKGYETRGGLTTITIEREGSYYYQSLPLSSGCHRYAITHPHNIYRK